MSSDEKVLDFPRVEGTSEENARRVMIEATRLTRLAPGEWRLWIDRSAERVPPDRRRMACQEQRSADRSDPDTERK